MSDINPHRASMTNEQRRQWAAGLFRKAMSRPESFEAQQAVDVLCATARGGSTYIGGEPQLNPLYTRRLATMVVGWLAIHGWRFPYGKTPQWDADGCTIQSQDLDASDLAGFLFHRDNTP